MAFQQQMRLARAPSLIARGEPAAAAMDTGYADQSHLPRQFKRYCPVTTRSCARDTRMGCHEAAGVRLIFQAAAQSKQIAACEFPTLGVQCTINNLSSFRMSDIQLTPNSRVGRDAGKDREDLVGYDRLLNNSRNWAFALLILTAVHHAWGAYIYAAPFRMHVVLIAIPSAIVIGWIMQMIRRRIQRDGRGGAVLSIAIVVLAVLILGIGIFEGGYNHVLKNFLYFLGTPSRVMGSLYPAPTYEMPDNFFFEATGMLQFPVSLLLAFSALKLLRHEVRLRGTSW